MPRPLLRIALGILIAVAAWLALNLVLYMLALSVLGPFGMIARGDDEPPQWFTVVSWSLQALMVVLSVSAGHRWAWRFLPAPDEPPADDAP